MTQPIVIIGSGLAGYLFAKEFRQHNKERPLTIITASDGRFYSKPLLSTALTKRQSPEALAMENANTMAEKLNAMIYTNSIVESVDAKQQLVFFKNTEGKSQQVEYSDLVFACGANKIKPPLEGDGVSDIHSVNNIEDYETFREWVSDKKHIGILGAGLVGCEFANDLVNVGYQVTVIAPEHHPLANLVPEPIGQMLLGALAEKGVSWRLGHFAKRVDREGSHYRVILTDDSTVEVDGVMSAVGLRPHCALANSAGIKTNRGIMVDSQCRSNDSNIYAVGDCAEVNGELRLFVAPLLQCARILAKVLAGQDVSLQYSVMPIVIKTPACPVVAVPPPKNVEGKWHIEGEDGNLSALYKDSENRLRGFALVGNRVREKTELVGQLVEV